MFVMAVISPMIITSERIYATEGVEISAESAIVIDLDRGQVLYERYVDRQFPARMLSRLMTTLIATEKYPDVSTQITVSTNAAEAGGYEDIVLKAGSMYQVDDIISASMMTMTNNTCTALFESVDTNSENFVGIMNARAQSMSLKNTLFTTPTGEFDDICYTTAKDISLFMQYTFGVQVYKDIFLSKIRFVDKSVKESGYLQNKNEVLWRYNYSSGGVFIDMGDNKVSTITFASRNDMNLLTIMINASSEKYVDDVSSLFEHCFFSYERNVLAKKGQKLSEIEVGNETLELIASSDVYYLARKGKSFISNAELVLTEEIETPVVEGRHIGSIRYTLEDGTRILVPLQAANSIYSDNALLNDILKKLTSNSDVVLLILALVGLEVILVVRYVRMRTRGNNKKTQF